MLTAVGRAPKLKQNKFKVKRSHTFQNLITFVKGHLEKAQVITSKDSIVSSGPVVGFLMFVIVHVRKFAVCTTSK